MEPSAPQLSIQVRGLTFTYPESRRTRPGGRLFSLTLDAWKVSRGSRVALHGPSGCGKSTLLDLIAGVLRPTGGEIEVEGQTMSGASEKVRRAHRVRSIGFIFQDFPLVDYLNLRENVLFPYRLNSALRLDEEVRDRASSLLADLGLADSAGARPAELSQGERQRVAIARALITQPRLLLADEPTAGLDPEQSLRVLRRLEALCDERQLTMLMVTHDPRLLERFDQVLAVGDLTVTEPPESPGR